MPFYTNAAYDLTLQEFDDETLVVILQECGYQPAKDELLARYHPWTRRLVIHLARCTGLTIHDVEDASQDAVFGLLKAITYYNTDELGKPSGCLFRSFLWRVVVNRFKDFLKLHRRIQSRFGGSLQSVDRFASAAQNELHWTVKWNGIPNPQQQEPDLIVRFYDMCICLATYINGKTPATRSFLEELMCGTGLRAAGQKVGFSYDKAKRTRRRLRTELAAHLEFEMVTH